MQTEAATRATDVDPSIRLQNIALESYELLAQRSMTWSEATNRTTMFMTVVGASVLALALVANATDFGADAVLFALLVLPVVLVIGLTSLARVSELNREDIRWVQGLNRLRRLRLELDPGFAPYIVTSPHDDVNGVLSAYGGVETSRFHGFYTLPALVSAVDSALGGFLAAIVAVQLGSNAVVAAIIGAFTGVLLFAAIGVQIYRAFMGMTRTLESRFPTPSRPHD